MIVFSVLSRMAAVGIGLFSLLGALWIAAVTPGMGAGLCAFSAAFIPATRPGETDKRSRTILALSLIGLLFQIGDVASYYLVPQFPGNYYFWPASIVYFVTLACMALVGLRSLPRRALPDARA